MHTTKYTLPLCLIHRDGSVREFETIAELREACRKLPQPDVWKPYLGNIFWKEDDKAKALVAVHHAVRHHWDGESYNWIACDSTGRPITAEELWPKRRYYYNSFYFKQKRRAEELGLPIPNTRCHRGGHHNYRGMHFRSVYRALAGAKADLRHDPDHYEARGALSRIPARQDWPPNNYDDIGFSRRGNNWKNYRRTRWK